MIHDFLPICRADMDKRGWESCDFVYVCGDAYVDHPSFGHAIISRVLEDAGYKVGIISQPDWKNPASINALGEPRLGFLVMGGNMDSMVNHYTVSKAHRKADAYTPGGVMGKRPDYAVTVYCNLIRRTYRRKPIIIGGIEASLRRTTHYDFWTDSLRRSILLDAKADLLIYGMGELAMLECARRLAEGKSLHGIDGTAWLAKVDENNVPVDLPEEWLDLPRMQLPSHEAVQAEATELLRLTQMLEQQVHRQNAWAQQMVGDRALVLAPPARPLTTEEMDKIYALPYARAAHPRYREPIPADEMLRTSITSHRGCGGGCSFCSLALHQGRRISSRSQESILAEARKLVAQSRRGQVAISDVGGPTANLRHPSCKKQLKEGVCAKRVCLAPKPCPNLDADESDYVALLRKLRKIPGIKKIFIRSGIRYDYMLCDKRDTFFRELVQYHISGQLKVAPEHVSDAVLARMGKPKNAVYNQFVEKYFALNRQYGMNQYLVPYLMSSHPGSTLKEAVELAEYIRDMGYNPEQVQDFYPTPSTLSTVMYCTGLDPRTMERVYVPTDPHEKAMQRALIQYRDPKNYALVQEALVKAHREDLIGSGAKCLIRSAPPRPVRKKPGQANGKRKPSK